MKKALKDPEDATNQNSIAWENWLHSVSDSLADAIISAKNLGDVLKGVLTQLAKSELSNFLYESFGGTGKTGSVFAGLGKISGFADGGTSLSKWPSFHKVLPLERALLCCMALSGVSPKCDVQSRHEAEPTPPDKNWLYRGWIANPHK